MCCNFYYDLTAMRERANELERLNEQLRCEIERLNDQEAALAGMWEGPAKEAFRRSFHNDAVQMRNFYNTVRVFIDVLLTITVFYSYTETLNRDRAKARCYC